MTWRRLGFVLSKPTIHLIWVTKYRHKVLLGLVKVRLEELLEMIAEQNGCRLLAARVYNGDHVYVFVSAALKIAIAVMVHLFKCISAKVLLEEFAEVRLQLWVGHLWSEGYVVRTAGDVTGPKIEE